MGIAALGWLGWLRHLEKPLLSIGPSLSNRLAATGAIIAANDIARDGSQPGGKTVARPVVLKPVDVKGDGRENLLNEIWGIVPCYVVLPAPAIDHWTIKAD